VSPNERERFSQALFNLRQTDDVFERNHFLWLRWDEQRRARWAQHMKHMADEGLPIAVKLVAEVSKLRMLGK
jgi:hypothetical protein